jgi:cytochrome c-type biogenesis protein CcmE
MEVFMKNKSRLIGIIAIVAVIGFAVASCATTATSNVPATLTITGLDAYNGLYIAAEWREEIYAAAGIVDSQDPMTRYGIQIGGVIENGSVTLPVWVASVSEILNEEDLYPVVKERYTGSGPLDFFVRIWKGQEVFLMGYTVAGGNMSVTFNNGKAERIFVLSFTPDDDD